MSKFFLVVAVVIVMAGCGTNYSGHGNEFKIQATIDHVGKHSVTVRDVDAIETYGKAENWFHGKHQIHDNYNKCDFHGRHYVGNVYDAQGDSISLRDLSPGATVEITGAIRENASSCGKTTNYSWRPVFDYMEVSNDGNTRNRA